VDKVEGVLEPVGNGGVSETLDRLGTESNVIGEVMVLVTVVVSEPLSVLTEVLVPDVPVPGGLVGLVIGVDFVGVLGVERVLELVKVVLLAEGLLVVGVRELVVPLGVTVPVSKVGTSGSVVENSGGIDIIVLGTLFSIEIDILGMVIIVGVNEFVNSVSSVTGFVG